MGKKLGQGPNSGEFESGPPMTDEQLTARWESIQNAGREDTPLGREIEARFKNMKRSNELTKQALKSVKKAKGGSVSSASKRADGCATKGKTKGKMV